MADKVLGVDIGGVVIDKANDKTDTSFFSANYLLTTATPDAFQTLAWAVRERFGGRVHLVSVAGPNTQRKTREWFEHHRFHEVTGIPRDHVHFVRRRFEKTAVCRELGITHFVDDRLEVLGYLHPMVPHLYLFEGDPREVTRHARFETLVRHVASWRAWKEIVYMNTDAR